MVLSFVMFFAQSSFSIAKPSSLSDGDILINGCKFFDVYTLNFKSKYMSSLGLSLNFLGEYIL